MKAKVKSLFEHYRQNLNALRAHPGVKFPPDLQRGDVVVCPLCLKYAYTASLADLYLLTIEHAPPHALQGKGVALTCKACNNHDGSHLDSLLVDHVQQMDAAPATRLPLPRHAAYGLMRAAYLLAFRDLGYGYLYNKNLDRLRRQFQQPNDELVPPQAVHLLDGQHVPDSSLGLNIAAYPSGLKSFYPIFDIQIRNHPAHRIGVLLPGPTNDDGLWYEQIEHLPTAAPPPTLHHCAIHHDDKLTTPLLAHQLWKVSTKS